MNIVDYMSRLPMKRRNLFKSALTVTASTSVGSALMAACGAANPSNANASSGGNFPNHTKWKFVFVNHVTTNAFFTPTQYGIQDACALLGCTYQWTGSEGSVVSEMVAAFDAGIAAKADGIAVAIIDQTAFNQPVLNALSAGIPVVSYNPMRPAMHAWRTSARISTNPASSSVRNWPARSNQARSPASSLLPAR
jgi:simple sugar transport system substrate-binding protein